MIIKFCKEATPVSDYEVEDFFQANKDAKVVKISSILVLYRFRTAVYKKEIKPFKIEVIDFDGKFYDGVCTTDGRFNEMGKSSIYRAKVIDQLDQSLNTLIGI